MTDKFATKAANWDNNNPRMLMIKSFLDEIEKRSNLNKGSHILDFGSGTGLVGLHFAESVAKVTLVDSSPAMLEMAHQKIRDNRIGNVQVVEGSIEDVNKVETEDLIVSMMTLHHVADIPNLLKEFHALLKTNGKVIIGDLLTEDGSFHFPETVPQNGFDETTLRNQFVEAGFEIDHFDTFHTMHREVSTGEKKSFDLFLLIAKKI